MSHSPGPWTWHAADRRLLDAAGIDVLIPVRLDSMQQIVGFDGDTKLIAAAPRMLDMLRKLEWGDHDALVDDDGLASSITMEPVCPCCKMGGPHGPDCELAALLEELK